MTLPRPETRYVSVGDGDVAYQVVGEGPVDLCYFVGFGHLDVRWQHPLWAKFLEGLASFSRLILFDRRGTGASDPIGSSGVSAWEHWSEDLAGVLDAAESQSTAIYAEGDGGPIATLFTAMHPSRVRALILSNTSARWLAAPDYRPGLSLEDAHDLIAAVRNDWGTVEGVATLFPSHSPDVELAGWSAQNSRAAATPRRASALFEDLLALDVRTALPLIDVPTLVLHTTGNGWWPIDQGRYLAEHIPNARLVELPGNDAYSIGSDRALDEVTEFVTGERPAPTSHRVLATILFTDIVNSTELLASRGDLNWRATLDLHDQITRGHVRRHRGSEVNTTGDGFVISFDGPGRAIACARDLVRQLGEAGIEIRAGLHSGECELRGTDIAGLTVHIAARVGSLAAAGEVLVSSTVRDLVLGSGLELEDRGERTLKGIPGSWRIFAA